MADVNDSFEQLRSYGGYAGYLAEVGMWEALDAELSGLDDEAGFWTSPDWDDR